MTDADRDAFLAFFRAAGALKDTLRSGFTPAGRPESTAEHSWRLCLLALALADELDGIDLRRLIELLIVHDLGEAVSGDIPAPDQRSDKSAEERAAFASLAALLPPAAARRLTARWEEYAAAATAEARLAKALDRLETVLTHSEGTNPADFDYGFNLGYGRAWTDPQPVVAALRAPVDAETARREAERLGRS